MVHINGATIHDSAQMPHGGWKKSGFGRFNGIEGIREFTQTKVITINEVRCRRLCLCILADHLFEHSPTPTLSKLENASDIIGSRVQWLKLGCARIKQLGPGPSTP